MNNALRKNRFWSRWILHYSLGELVVVGIATTFGRLILIELSDYIDRAPILMPWLLLAVVGVAEGCTIGYLQWHSLNKLLTNFQRRPWIFATMGATTIGWMLIMPPSIFLMAFFVDFHLINQYYSVLYAILAGTAFGGVIGFIQYLILRRYYKNAVVWLFSNMLGWMLSFFIVYLCVSMLNPDLSLISNIIIMISACVFSGLVQGLVVGTSLHFLMSVKESSNPKNNARLSL